MPKLLVVDDEPNVLYSIEKALRSDTLELIGAQTGHEAIELARRMRPDAAIVDVRLSDMSGLEVFDRIREIDPRLPVIIVTAYGATETTIEAMKHGAYEYLLKPFEVPHLRDLVQRALELSRFRHVPAIFHEGEINGDADRIVGRSPAMQEVYKTIGRVAATELTVLITGESGTGKELVARALWQHSGRADKTFLTINCAAIPETLLESELFGHEKGASREPTGAALAGLSKQTAAPCSSTKSPICRPGLRPSCCASYRNSVSSGSAARRRSGPMFVCWQRPIKTSRRRYRPGVFATTCSFV